MKTLPHRKQYLFIALITLFLALLVFQLATGIALFILKIGIMPIEMKIHFLGTSSQPPVSLEGLYDSLIPHLATISLVNLIVGHFLMMLERPSQKLKFIWIAILFASGIGNSLAGLLIRFLNEDFVFLKFLCFVVYEISFVGALIWLGVCLWQQMITALEQK